MQIENILFILFFLFIKVTSLNNYYYPYNPKINPQTILIKIQILPMNRLIPINITNPKYSPAASALGENPRHVLPSIL